ncbi:hypothetical protein BGZ70_002607 [Mortierella alpina]|uniref:FAD-binding FR-type domain-containing protein n=1 Tax=Mortierella alpina TaxID=64518 RepID=A0A9P6ITW9_MORAP|nr:hypothetical protein BGZ70_002607 [Mortierella alpina]
MARYGHASARIGLDYALTCCGASFEDDRPPPCLLFSVTSTTFVTPQLKWDPALRFDDFANGRMYASMVTSVPDNNVLYIFGGLQAGKASQDLYRLDASKLPDITITKIPPPADAALLPSARFRHAAVTVGSLHGFMIIQGGMGPANMSDPNVYYFDMRTNTWIDGATFKEEYAKQKSDTVKQVDVWFIIVGILAGTLALGGLVGLYIHTGVKNDERERQRKEADERDSARFSAMAEHSPNGERSMMEGKGHPIYPRGGSEDHSISMGPFKSTSAHAVITEPLSPGGTTLTENGNQSGYFSSSVSSSTPSRLHKNSSNGSSQHSRHGAGPVDAAASISKKGPSTSAAAAAANGRPGHEPYYNPRDLFLDDDDDSSITVSLASESSLSPWAGPVRMSSDLAPPNPRFSRGAISQAHRQLVGSMNAGNGSGARGGDSSGWDTSSPGGSLSSREDSEHQRRSVNSMQQFDLAAQRSNLTIRNASMYGNNNRSSVQSNSNMNRRSMFDGSDTTEDSGSYYSGPNGKRISTAMAARQQRRSLRHSQDSQPSASAEPFTTTVLPVVTSKVTKPTMAKVVTHQRGSRVVMPSQGPLGDRGNATVEDGEIGGGLGIDFSGFSNEGYLPGGNSNSQSRANGTSFTNAAAYQSRRGSSTLNPAHNRTAGTAAGATGSKRESRTPANAAQRVRNSTNVILQMPPAPKHPGSGSGSNSSGGQDNEQRIGHPHSQERDQEAETHGAQTPAQIWRLLDRPLIQHAGPPPAGSAGGSAPTLAGLGSTLTLKPTGGSSAREGEREGEPPLQSSPSQLSIEKAIAQKFASLGTQQQSIWRVRWDQFVQNEGPRVLFLLFWGLLQLLIFLFSFEIYNGSSHYSKARADLGITLGVSRGAAAVINLDCGLILFSVCRNLISLLRSTFLNDIVPFDKNILFHKTIAWSIVLFSVVHSVSHYVNYYRLEKVQMAAHQEQVSAQGGGGAGGGARAAAPMTAQAMAFLTGPGLTGHILVLLLFLMVTASTADTPPYCKTSPGSYKFVLVSLFFYILERTAREIRARKPTSITKIVLHPSKVVEVQIQKEGHHRRGAGGGGGKGDTAVASCFRAKAGQYVFLSCPDISVFEWHPFTITSAPEEDYVSVHIRIVGDWTTAFAKRLGCSFDDEQQFWIEELISRSSSAREENETLVTRTGASQSTSSSSSASCSSSGSFPLSPTASTMKKPRMEVMTLPRVLMDGPYGSPSEDAFNYEIAVLVGAGIGVTPFASVLKHIWYSVMQPTKVITLRKVYFFWVCRDRDAFEWFQDLLIALEEQNMSDFLEIRSYLTGELGSEELNTVLMEARATAATHAARLVRRRERKEGYHQRATTLEEEKEEEEEEKEVKEEDPDLGRDRDAITGLRSPTYYGRPNFDKIFGELALAHPREQGQVGVFFCGPKPLGKTLHRCALKYKFKFHKENF